MSTFLLLWLLSFGTLDGSVVDERGRPLADAEVRFSLSRTITPDLPVPPIPELRSVRTSADGRFRIAGLEAGWTYDVVAVRRGSAPLSTIFTFRFPGPQPELRLVLRPGRAARGIVLDEAGRPVEGAEVELSRSLQIGGPLEEVYADDSPPVSKGLHRTRTDAAGRFAIPDLPEGRFDVAVRGLGRVPLFQEGFEIPRGSEPLDLGSFRLARGSTVEVRITDPEGRPLAGAEVWDQGAERPLAVTGPDGRFVLQGLQGRFGQSFDVCREGFASGSFEASGASGAAVEVALSPAARISGQVLGAAGDPVSGARVQLFDHDAEPVCLVLDLPASPCPEGGAARTDEEGRFELAPLRRGRYELRVQAAGYAPAVIEKLDLEAGRPLEGLRIDLRHGADLSGRVLDMEGRPVAGAEIRASCAGDASARTVPDGYYRLRGLEPGRCQVSASHPDHEGPGTQVWIESGENRQELRMIQRNARHPVRGRVMGPDGEPIAAATVNEVVTDSDGGFVLRLENGDHDLQVDALGYAPSWREVRVAGSPVEGIEIRLDPGIAVSGRLLGSDPDESAEVFAYQAGEPGATRMGLVDRGTYRVAGLGPGEWVLAVRSIKGTLDERIVLDPGDTERVFDLRLPETFEVRGRVVGPEGEPIARAWVKLSGSERGGSDMTAPDGTFSTWVAAGTYDLTVEHGEHVEIESAVLGVPGETSGGIEIRMQKGAVIRGRVLGLEEDELRRLPIEARSGSRHRSGRVSSDGEYVIPGLAPGEWHVKAHYPRRDLEARVTLLPETQEAAVDLLYTGELTLTGRIVGSNEPLLLGLELRRVHDGRAVGAAILDGHGQFRIDRLEPGSYRLVVMRSSPVPIHEEMVEISSDLDVLIDLAEP